jgi:uncharacterized Fe-S cluster-containing radical SAM superfamily protein
MKIIFQFTKNIEVKIIDPTSVQVIETMQPEYQNYQQRYFRAEIISTYPPIKLPLYSDNTDKVVRSLAKEINEFLLSPNTTSFHKKF